MSLRGLSRQSVRTPRWPTLLLLLSFFSLVSISRGTDYPTDSRVSTPAQISSPQPAHPQETPPLQQVKPPVSKRPPIRLAMLRKLYECADGVQVIVVQESDAARVTLNNQTYELKRVPSNDSGIRYTAGAVAWSVIGDTGVLQDATDPAKPTLLADGCRQKSILPPASAPSPPTNSVRGTLNLSGGKELPKGAEIRLRLLDMKSPNHPHKWIAVKTFKTLEGKPPIPFELVFDPQSVNSPDCCVLSAEVLVNGKAAYATAKPLPIADLAHPNSVTLDLVSIRHKAAQP